MMNKISKSPTQEREDRLASFVDESLAGNVKEVEMEADEELITLEKTILRMQSAFPPVTLDQATVKRMQVRLNSRIKKESQEAKQPFWKKWFAPQARLQFGIAFAAMALLVTFAIFNSTFPPAGSSATATALKPISNTFIALALAGLIVVFLWIKRLK